MLDNTMFLVNEKDVPINAKEEMTFVISPLIQEAITVLTFRCPMVRPLHCKSERSGFESDSYLRFGDLFRC